MPSLSALIKYSENLIPTKLAGKAQPMFFRFVEVAENVDDHFKAKFKHCPAQISASTKATPNLVLHFKVNVFIFILFNLHRVEKHTYIQ